MPFPDSHGAEKMGAITTTGRRSGREHTVELWFCVDDGDVYLLCGDCPNSDWYRNAMANPRVVFASGEESLEGRAEPVDDPDIRGRIGEVMRNKYGPFEGTIDYGRTEVEYYFELRAVKVSEWVLPDAGPTHE